MTQITRAQIDEGMKQARIERALAFRNGLEIIASALARVFGISVPVRPTTATCSKNYAEMMSS